MTRPRLLLALLVFGVHVAPAEAAAPRIVSVRKIWDKGRHNAFTDLTRWRGKWYCAFRESEGHVGGDGGLRVLESADGDTWESVALLTEEGIDLRDPKLAVTPDGRLMIVAGGSVYQGTRTLKGRQPRVAFSSDGRSWTPTRRVLREGDWLWRVTWHGGKAYGISYDARGTDEWVARLVESTDGVDYTEITKLDVTGKPNESTIRFLPDGTMLAMVRREGGNQSGLIGRSPAPYTKWEWRETGHRLGGPNFIRLPDGSLWAGSREHAPKGATTVVARITEKSYEPVLTLPSGGDTSYPGLVWHEGLLWFSYYSSHEGKTSIYLAKVAIPLEAESIGKRLEPFFDDGLVDRKGGAAELVLQRPTPAELVLTADSPWEGNTSAYYTVFQDGSLYRMYYRGSHFDEAAKKPTHREVACYAESRDGIHWTKPDLGLFEFNGSKHNNIVWDGPGTHDFTPFLDANPACPPDRKYKALGVRDRGLLAFHAADGIHWTLSSDMPVITKGAFDSQNLAFWDPHIKTYREYHRQFRGNRDIMTARSTDFLAWPDPVFLDYTGAPLEHLYTNAVMPYFRAPHVLIGFPTRFKPATEQTEPTFMVSRDGQQFHRYPDAVIPPSAPADRDGNRSNYMAWGLVQLPGREHERELSVYAKEAYYKGKGSRVRRFVYRVDGFVALSAGASGGEIVTRPIRFEGGTLRINARTRPGGSVRAELLDADGSPVPGHGLADSRPFQGDEIAAAMAWAKGADVAALAGKPARLRLVLENAEVFSFRFD